MARLRYKIFTTTTAFLLVLLLATSANSQQDANKQLDQKAKQRWLKREAANALHRFNLRLAKDGFYSGRVALNVWRSTAIDAGTFDQQQYEKYKVQLYEKSVNDSLECFEEFVGDDFFYDANICLQTWRMHSKELGTYDQAQYEVYKKKLTDARAANASKAKEAEESKD